MSVPHIVKEYERLFPEGIHRFDGELYNHALTFEEITSIVRKSKSLDERHGMISHEVFDYVDEEKSMSFEQRYHKYLELLSGSEIIRPVPHSLINDRESLMHAHKSFMAAGFEGTMVRDMGAIYENTKERSTSVLKLKDFVDAEFEIVGVKEGKGKLKGHGIFVCKTDKGVVFDVKLVGDTSKLKEILENKDSYIGKLLTCSFMEYTSKGAPRHPNGERIREDI